MGNMWDGLQTFSLLAILISKIRQAETRPTLRFPFLL